MGKWYVVWTGREPGIYDNWDDCEEQVRNFPGAKFKSFKTQEQAVLAYRGEPDMGLLRALAQGPAIRVNYAAIPEIRRNSIAVDGACSGNPGIMEYRGVDIDSGIQLFHQGPFPDATNNIGEFLAIVHALAWLYNKGDGTTAVYSDSRSALAWVRNRQCRTKLERTSRNGKVFELVQRAEQWLKTHSWHNAVIKWDTDNWGENPADFGRK